jgi:glutathione S-transferase
LLIFQVATQAISKIHYFNIASIPKSTMSSRPSKPIAFYDIAFKAPREETNTAVNPWKTRLALNFKALPHTTIWVPLPDVEKVRRSLQVPASRKFGDGSDYYTLPVITDPNTNEAIGDSFDIAEYLQKTYPDSGLDLFPEQKLDYVFTPDQASPVPISDIRGREHDEYAKFNMSVDEVFTAHVILMAHSMLLEPAGEQVFVKRAGVDSFDAFACVGEQRKKVLVAFEKNLAGLADVFKKDESGPFVLGTKASYADIIVGGWLRMANRTLNSSEWNALKGWHGGVFGRLHDALDQYAFTDKGREV